MARRVRVLQAATIEARKEETLRCEAKKARSVTMASQTQMVLVHHKWGPMIYGPFKNIKAAKTWAKPLKGYELTHIAPFCDLSGADVDLATGEMIE